MKRPASTDVDKLLLENVRWQAVLDTARDAIVSIDGQGRIILFNRCAEAMFGYASDEVLGQNVRLLMPEPDAGAHDEYLRRYERTGEARAIGRIRTVAGQRKSGEVFPVELSVSETSLAEVTCYTAILRDVSELRGLQSELRREADFSALLVETARLLVLVLDADGRVVECNPFLAELVGLEAAALVGRDWGVEHVPEHDRRRFALLLGDGGEGRTSEHPVLGAGGEERWVEWRATAHRDAASGEVVGRLLVGQDVTRRRRDQETISAYRHLVQDRERRGDFAALLAQLVHDLGNPLAGLSAQAQLIRGITRRNAEAPLSSIAESAELISAEIRRLETQVRELLTFSRQQQRLEVRRIDARAFLDRIAGLWRPVAQARSIALEVQVATGLECFRGDEEKLRRVVENLVKNAIDAIEAVEPIDRIQPVEPIDRIQPVEPQDSTGPVEPLDSTGPVEPLDSSGGVGGRIWLVLEPAGPEGIEIRVCDDGPGLAPGIQVFRLFETTKSAGSGLGLALSRQLVQAHGGEMRYEPREPRGACFIVSLPEALAAPAAERAPP